MNAAVLRPHRRAPRRLALALLLAAACPLLAAQTAGPVPEIYTCIDAKGRKLTSDRPIAECADREQKILNPSGTVKSRIGPRLSDLEQSRLDAQRKAAQAEQARIEEERKRDRALLIRFPTPELHQKERAAQIAHVEAVKQTGIGKRQELQAERARLEGEMSFYEKDPAKAPARLRQQLAELGRAEAELQRFLDEQDREIARINARFDDEQQRLTPLWLQAGALKP